MIKKIITHDGLFHADEVMAIALIYETIGEIPVERTRNISAEDKDDVDVWIIDVGGEYIPSEGLFDHHQDETLEASCSLILHKLWVTDVISTDLYEELLPSFQVVSNIDRSGPTIYNGWQVNSLIKSLNSFDGGFDMALDMCRLHIQACKDSVAKIAESREIWDNGTSISLFIRWCDKFPIHWKRYKDAGEMFLIYPNKGKYNVLSRDSALYPIYPSENQEFLHNERFLAVFPTREDAERCAQLSVSNIVE